MNTLFKSMTMMLCLIAGLPAMENENTDLGNCAPEIASIFLTEVVKNEYVNKDFTSFLEKVRPLREVCSEWNRIIDKTFMHEAMVLGCQQICPEFLNGKLIYRPTEGSDEGMIELKISDLWNPLGGTINLFQCGDTGRYISILTGYRKGTKAENLNKVEIWLIPRFLVEKELDTTAGHLKPIFPSYWPDSASVGILWTWGGDNKMDRYDYLIIENMDNLSKINLYEDWRRGDGAGIDGVRGGAWREKRAALSPPTISSLVCELK